MFLYDCAGMLDVCVCVCVCVQDLCNSQGQCESGGLLKRQLPVCDNTETIWQSMLLLLASAVSMKERVWSPYRSRWCWQHSNSFYVPSNLL